MRRTIALLICAAMACAHGGARPTKPDIQATTMDRQLGLVLLATRIGTGAAGLLLVEIANCSGRQRGIVKPLPASNVWVHYSGADSWGGASCGGPLTDQPEETISLGSGERWGFTCTFSTDAASIVLEEGLTVVTYLRVDGLSSTLTTRVEDAIQRLAPCAKAQ